MKKYIFSFICVMFLFIGGVKANTINKIDMDIYIDKNGDAYVKETWDYTSSSNTEIYHAYPNMGDSTITDFKVSDSTDKEYTYESNWDIHGSFDSKQYKYGYNYTDNGVELCLGISHYGNYKYYLSYKINGFIYNVEDAQIAYWTLLQPTSENLGEYYVKIHADEPFEDSLDVWGFGDYGAYAYVYDGYIELSSDNAVSSDEYVTVLVKFKPNTFNTEYTLDYDFEDIEEMAKEGATAYVDKKTIGQIIKNIISSFFEILLVPLIMIIAFFKAFKNSSGKLYKKTLPPKDVQHFRDFPCGDDMFRAYFVANEYQLTKSKTDFFGTLLLKWIKDNIVTIETADSGLFKANQTKINMPKQPTEVGFQNPLEVKMYSMMYNAANDGVLEKKEFTRYCQNHYNKVLGWFDEVINSEFNNIKMTDLVCVDEKKKHKYNATPKLDEIGLHMAGLRKFYKEFGSIGDKQAIEVKLWREHLMYAQIFGLATEVAKEFKALYPTEIVAQEIDTVIMANNFSTSAVSAAQSARSRAESYSSGGGGFSSGGGGGGSFGGGGSMGSR